MKRFRVQLTLMLTALLCSATAGLGWPVPNDKGFGVKEYDQFHAVLHPLQHEALPNQDFARIRSRASELVKLGEAIVKLGIPRGTTDTNTEQFEKELKKFSAALVRFSADAKNGTDDQLKESYSCVHDSFEILAALLPRK